MLLQRGNPGSVPGRITASLREIRPQVKLLVHNEPDLENQADMFHSLNIQSA